MDNLTHSLTAVALSRAFGKRVSPHSTAILLLAVNLPDVDIVGGFRSSTDYLHCHRGITHSFALAPLVALAVVLLVIGYRKLRHRDTPLSPLRAWLLALFGVLFGHLFLDWSTSYGTRLLLPFSGRWLAWDAVPIIDVWLLAALVTCWLAPHFFGLIGEEIGARGRKSPSWGSGWGRFAVVFLLAWFGFRGVLHARAVAMLDARLYHGNVPERTAAFASMTNPFHWYGVVQTAPGWELADVDVLEQFDPTQARLYRRPEPSPALDAARSTRPAQVFLDFARFPYAYVDTTEDGYHVVIRDLRFQAGPNGPAGFAVVADEDRQFQVRDSSFGFRPRTSRR